MPNKITELEIKELAGVNGIEYATLRAIIDVEASGHGFDPNTGKIVIQFEPSWYKRRDSIDGFSGHGVWESNKVENQKGEWIAFNSAFALDQDAAMESTSIGLMQVMGFHYRTLGFKTVGEMWDFAKISEENQVEIAIRFIKSIPKLDKALRNRDAATFAYYYNGRHQRFYTNSFDLQGFH